MEAKTTVQLEKEISLQSIAEMRGESEVQVARNDIGRAMARSIIRELSAEQSASIALRKLEVALRPMADRLHYLKKQAATPAPVYEASAFPPEDRVLIGEIEAILEEYPEEALRLDGFLRVYDIIDCETLNSAFRSWLAPAS